VGDAVRRTITAALLGLVLFAAACGDDELVGLDRALLAWAEFVIPFILLSDPSNLRISVGILNFQGAYQANSTGILAAGSILAILPAIVLFVALQRFIVGTFTAGALKG
jgi:ABC-type glycerol-3-phosphate transport system permease component